MKIISSVEINNFRSIQKLILDGVGDFTAIAGLNNSGKSNILRALHAFFNEEVEPGVKVDVTRDYYRSALGKKKKKIIRVSVDFVLPSQFRFRGELGQVETFLGRSFRISKEWTRDSLEPVCFINNSQTHLNRDDAAKVKQFLSLISFRYIPNRVLPTDVIRKEQGALRDALVRRLGKNAPNPESLFRELQTTSSNLIRGMSEHFRKLVPHTTDLRLKTPESWEDILFAMGYQLSSGGIQLDDSVQGSGVQSLLMFETLALIDRDYFQRFGWRQAAIWAVEEPESSLHTSLEAQLAAHLATLARDMKGRLQIFSTTHSELMIQYSDSTAYLVNNTGSTTGGLLPCKQVLERAAIAGVSRWTHPLLYSPLTPLVLVEGQYDVDFLEAAFRILRPRAEIRVSSVGGLEGVPGNGGIERLKSYLKEHRTAIQARRPDAKIIVLIDWETTSKRAEFEKLFHDSDRIKVIAWSMKALNPKLGDSFKGIERAFSDRLIENAELAGAELARRKDGTVVAERDKYHDFKAKCNVEVKRHLEPNDLEHCREFLEGLLKDLLER